MKHLFFLVALTAILSSCHIVTGSGNLAKETRSVSNFKRIHASHGFAVEFRYGDPSLVIEADDNVMKYVEVDQDGDKLEVGLKANVSLRDAHLRAIITTRELIGVETSSGAQFTSSAPLKSDGKLSFSASSGSYIGADVDAPKVFAETSSGSRIELGGRTKDYEAEASGGSDIQSASLMSENTNVSASSGASAHVHASVQLDARASSGGTVHYSGGANARKEESSGGSVKFGH